MNIHEENILLKSALNTIAGGYTNRFPGAPDVDMTPEQFQSKMWTWSQSVAKNVLEKVK